MKYDLFRNANFYADDGTGGWTPIKSPVDIEFSLPQPNIPSPNVEIRWDTDTAFGDPYSSKLRLPNTLPLITLCDGATLFMPQTSWRWDDPAFPLGGVVITPRLQCFIKCTPLMKETLIRLAEHSWNKCPFTGGCDSQDEYSCRKCLERRIKWDLVDD